LRLLDSGDQLTLISARPAPPLMARTLIAEDPRFGGRGRPALLVATELFLRRFGLGSLGDLPPRHVLPQTTWQRSRAVPIRQRSPDGDNHAC